MDKIRSSKQNFEAQHGTDMAGFDLWEIIIPGPSGKLAISETPSGTINISTVI